MDLSRNIMPSSREKLPYKRLRPTEILFPLRTHIPESVETRSYMEESKRRLRKSVRSFLTQMGEVNQEVNDLLE